MHASRPSSPGVVAARGVRRSSSCAPRSRSRRCGCSPSRERVRRLRRPHAGRRRDVLDVLLPHPVPAGRARLQPAEAGLAFLPMTVVHVLDGPGRAAARRRASATRGCSSAGCLVALVGMAWLSRLDGGHAVLPAASRCRWCCSALGMGVAFTPLTAAGIAGVAPRRRGRRVGPRQRRAAARRLARPRHPGHGVRRGRQPRSGSSARRISRTGSRRR